MSQSFPQATLEELKSRLNIVDVIGRVVPLRRAGSNFKGVCPFHNEKTPSFVVSEQKQIFTCFGCGASGDAIEFTKRYYNLEFQEAVEKLAAENGLSISMHKGNGDREKYYEINKEAARFFYRAFTEQQNAGYTYMKNRGMDDAILKKFGIGYADESWDSLYLFFKKKGISEKILLELGLISESKGKYYDKFRNRVMFPIINTSGKVIGFGGRAIGQAEPKYLNSPENKVFQKKNNLYALNITKQDIGKEGYAILVEGYMDAISLYQNGVRNVGASLGTALTDNQARLLNRYTKNVVLSYDADSAGRNAALRGIEVLSKQDCKVKVLHVTDGKDPDDFIKKNGKDAFLKLVDQALPMIDYKLLGAQKDLNLSTEEGKLDFMKKAAPILKNLGPVEADIYIQKIARELKISEGAIRMETFGGYGGETPPDKREPAYGREESQAKNSELPLLEATVLKLLLMNPFLSETLLEHEDLLESSLSRKVMNAAFELYGTRGDFHKEDILDRLEPEEGQQLLRRLEQVIIAGNEEQVFAECLHKKEYDKLRSKERELIDRLSLADESADENAVQQLTKELMEVQDKMKSHGGTNS